MSKFLSQFVERPILVFMLTLTILVMGVMSLTRIPLALLPDGLVGSNRINIWIPTRNLTPQEAEEQVYAPLEGQLLTIPGITESTGYCRSHSVRVFARIASATDIKLAAAEVRDRIERARASWPQSVDRWYTWRETAETLPMFFFNIGIPDASQKYYDLLQNEVQPKLERIEGVGEVSIFGMVGESVRIFFDRYKLSQLRVNFQQLLQNMADDNVTLPIGEIREGASRYIVRADLLYHDLDQIRDLPIGNGFKIRDVARVERVRSYRDNVSRVDGKVAVTGMIRQQAGANTVATARRVRSFFDDLTKEPRFAGIEPMWDFDKGKFIENTVGTLQTSAFYGGLLAFCVLILFLRRLRTTLMLTLSLPISLLVAITSMYFQGDSLNLFTMTSITLAIGMLVDNSVVVLENIDRLRRKGLSWPDACVQGVQGVGNAVSLATATTIAIFVPVMFFSANPNVQRQAFSMCLPLCIALVGSLFVALILLPAGVAFLNRRDTAVPAATGDELAGAPAKPSRFAGLIEHQVRFTDWVISHRKASIAMLVVLLVGLQVVLRMTFKSDVRMSGGDNIEMMWEFPRGTTLAMASRASAQYEQWIEKNKKSWGIRRVSARFNRKSGRLRISLPSGSTQEDLERVVKKLRGEMPTIPGIKPEVYSHGVQGDEAQEGNRGFMIELEGRDSEHLRRWALELKQQLLDAGLAETVDLGRSNNQDEIRINVDRGRMQELGVQPRTLFGIVSYGLSGQQVSRFRQPDGHELSIIAEFDNTEDMELKDLKEMRIWTPTGGQRLGSLAKFDFTEGYSSVRRRNGVLTTAVAGERPENVTMPQFSAALAKLVPKELLPRGYNWTIGGRFRDRMDWQKDLMSALMVGVVFVFLVMGFFFESVVLPFSVIGTVPLAILGGLTGMALFGRLFEPMVIFGLMILAGVIVNNGIVLLDHIVYLRREFDMSRRDAILEGVRDRIRPIVMTASTTIVGLLPMTMMQVQANQGVSYAGMSTVVASGLFFATFLTPFVVPLAYTLLDDLSVWGMSILHHAFAKPERSSAAAPVLDQA